jgi:hypothetical protein
MITQITNGTIDPNWVMVCIMGVAVYLLVRILNRTDKKLDDHDEKIAEHETRITVIEKKEE